MTSGPREWDVRCVLLHLHIYIVTDSVTRQESKVYVRVRLVTAARHPITVRFADHVVLLLSSAVAGPVQTTEPFGVRMAVVSVSNGRRALKKEGDKRQVGSRQLFDCRPASNSVDVQLFAIAVRKSAGLSRRCIMSDYCSMCIGSLETGRIVVASEKCFDFSQESVQKLLVRRLYYADDDVLVVL
ncbi:hypothetical protein Trydic_g14268 [Trypoxylus dichotomus]